MRDDTVGWSSFTDGASGISITKTTDGGATWAPVQNQTSTIMVLGLSASKSPKTLDVVTTGLGSTKYSVDGNNFLTAKGAPFVSQGIKLQDELAIVAAADGVCISADKGASYSCKQANLLFPGTGRYASAPSESTFYLTAGQWPSTATPPGAAQLTRNLRVSTSNFAMGTPQTRMEYGMSPGTKQSNGATYTAEIWKSSDGGNTWANLFNSTGEFYFNDIDCFDENNCVAVGEGFGQDGSTSPGARVYVTKNGKDFVLAHQEADTSSLMAAKMVSATEHFVGGTTSASFGAPLLALHSTDAGATYANEGGDVKGNMITSLDMVSPTHGYATTVNSLQICSLLEYGTAP